MYNTNENLINGGILPLFGQLVEMREQDKHNESKQSLVSVDAIKQFLVLAGFTEAPPFILECIAKLVKTSAECKKFIIKKEYKKLAQHEMSDTALPLQIAYYILKNYSAIKDYIYNNFNFNIGNNFDGNKNFIKKIALTYTTFYLKK